MPPLHHFQRSSAVAERAPGSMGWLMVHKESASNSASCISRSAIGFTFRGRFGGENSDCAVSQRFLLGLRSAGGRAQRFAVSALLNKCLKLLGYSLEQHSDLAARSIADGGTCLIDQCGYLFARRIRYLRSTLAEEFGRILFGEIAVSPKTVHNNNDVFGSRRGVRFL